MISHNGADRIGASASNFLCSFYRAKLAVWLVVGCFSVGNSFADIAPMISWPVDVTKPEKFDFSVRNGETIVAQPLYTEGEVAKNLTGAGYRVMPDPPALADGYTRISITAVEGDGVNGQWQVVDKSIAEIESEHQAAEAIRKASPIPFDQPIEAPLIVVTSQSGGKGIGITATADAQLVTVVVHESPWPDAVRLAAIVRAGVDKKNAINATGKAGVNGQLQERIENIERFLGWRT